MGYVGDRSSVPDSTLDRMAEAVRRSPHHLREDYRDDLLRVSHVHLGFFSPGTQPVFTRDGTLGAMAEGMVYDEAGRPGQGDDADPERWLREVAESFSREGAKAFAKLNGSYSFVIFDRKQGRVCLVSDRFSTRPLYYWHGGSELVFATEPKAILEHPSYVKKFNMVAFEKFFRYGRLCIFGDDTWFDGIRGLQPGSVLAFHEGEVSLERYWDLDYHADHNSTPEEFSERLVGTFRRAVKMRTDDRRLRYSVALSGGLDSRAVLAACRGNDRVTAYTFAARGTKEAAIASKVARAGGTKHTICYVSPDQTARYAEDVVSLSDGHEVVGITFLLLADERLDRSFDVSLDGFALDLTLGGSFLRGNTMKAKSKPELAAMLDRKFSVFSDSEMNAAFTPEFLARLDNTASRDFQRLIGESRGETVADQADYFALRTRVRNFTIMGHVLSRNYFEDTIPTLDNDFMDVITSIPVSLRFRYAVYKKFLKKLDPSLAGIAYERTGLSPTRPFVVWMTGIVLERAFKVRDEMLLRASGGRIRRFQKNAYVDLSGALRSSRAWRDLISHTLVNRESLMYRHGVARREYVLKLIDAHLRGTRDTREKLLYLITFELILRRFFPEGV